LELSKKKAQSLANFKTTITPAKSDDHLELDEIFTFYTMKINQIRIWIALNKRNRQIVSFHIGDGSMDSCKEFYRKLPYEYYKKHCFADFWRAYGCIPDEYITQVGKQTGLTNHVERLNCTIRQRFSRMVRKTLSFSKKLYMLNLHFKLWAYFYNKSCFT
jgi:IS1 family transposase